MVMACSPRVKICCIASRAEAELAVAHGASALGLVSAMPSGPGVIAEALIAAIARTVPPGVGSFLLTCEQDGERIIAQQRRCHSNVLQLTDWVQPATYQRLRAALPGIALVQAIHVRGPQALAEAREAAAWADALLLDSGNPQLAIKELGGTGRVHDWRISRQIRDAVAIPVYLAGGLHAGNVGDAIAAVQPFGVDVCSGVRSDGKLDAAKLAAFMASVRRACWAA